MTNPFVRKTTRRAAAAAALMAAIALPARADVTASEVWGQWKEYFQGFGYSVDATETPTADGIRITDFTMSMPIRMPPAEDDESGDTAGDSTADSAGDDEVREGTFAMTMGEMTLTDVGDGSVDITMPEVTPLTIRVTAPDEDPVEIVLDYTTSNFVMKATGTPDATDYTYAADLLKMALVSVLAEGEVQDLGTADLSFTGLSGTSSMTTGDMTSFDQDMRAEGMSYTIDFTNPDPVEGGTFQMSGQSSDLTMTGGGSVPEDIDPMDMSAALTAGYSVTGGFDYGAGSSTISVRQGEEAFDMRSTSEGGSLEVTLDETGVAYDVASREATVDASGSDIPFPVSVKIAEMGFGLLMPLLSGDEDQEFGLSLVLAGLELPEMLWMGADPQGKLPHDPLTLRLDLSGMGRLFVNLMDEEEMTQLGQTGGMPGAVESLRLNELVVEGAGAKVQATADLDVDNEAMSPLGPFPNVFGSADLQLTGVKALLSTLSEMGLIPAGQAMMISGMASELGEQASGPDDLTARVVLGEDGALSVNGKPIPLQ